MTVGLDLETICHMFHKASSGAALCSNVTGGLHTLSAVHDQPDHTSTASMLSPALLKQTVA